MELYFYAENRNPPVQYRLHAVLNLLADANVWFRVQTADLNSLSWDSLKLLCNRLLGLLILLAIFGMT